MHNFKILNVILFVMKIKAILIVTFLLTFSTYAQVGIGITSPAGALDITTPAATPDGLLIPRVALSATNVATVITPTVSELVYNTTASLPGPNQVSPGFYYWDGSLWIKLTTGSNADWSLLGNTGTVAAANFLGTTDDVDIVFKRNGIQAGYIGNPIASPTSQPNRRNTIFGANSLLNPATGNRNTVLGTNIMTGNTSGFRNVALGDAALSLNTTGGDNIAIGVGALYSNSTNSSNTAVGRNALTASTADFNTALGDRSLSANTTGTLNTATGVNSLFKNTTGNNNTGNGVQALRANTTGDNNTAYGYQTLSGNAAVPANASTFSNSTAVGYQSFYNNLTGSGNVGLGYQAGFNELTGNKLYIENSNADANNALIYGDFATGAKILRTNSQFQIGNPAAAFTGYSFPTVRPATVAGQILQYNAVGVLTFQTPAVALNSSAWLTTGNSGTTPGTNFLGTTTNVDLRIRTNNADRFNFTNNGRLRSYDDGLPAQPTYSWNAATGSTMGMYRIGANTLGFSTTSLERIRINATGQVFVNAIAGFATSTFYTAATGNNNAVDGNANSTGSAVYGQNIGTGVGVYGLTNNPNGIGVRGGNLSTGIGVYGQTAGAVGAGVFGVANVANGAGTYGTSNGASGIGIFGNSSGNLGNGVYGQATGTNGTGLFGIANNTGGDGVYGQATEVNRYGVWGVNNNDLGRGVYGSSIGLNGIGVIGEATSATGFGAFGNNTNLSGTGIIGVGNNAGGTYLINGSGGAFNGSTTGTVSFATDATAGVGIYAAGNNLSASVLGTGGAGGAFHGNTIGVSSIVAITGAGNDAIDRASFEGQYVSGGTTLGSVYVGARIGGINFKILGTGGSSVSTTMKTSQGEKILFAPEAPENWFFDLGEVELINGVAKVTLDPIFVECISDSKPFKVFVQGGENTLGSIRISRDQNDKSFLVEDLGGPSNGTVQYSIYAIWKGKDNIRFPELSPESRPKPYSPEKGVVNKINGNDQKTKSQGVDSKNNISNAKAPLKEPTIDNQIKTIEEN